MRYVSLRPALIGAALLVLTACADKTADEPVAEAVSRPVSTTPTAPTSDQNHRDIDLKVFMRHVRMLSADEFGGRSPASLGEEKTINYLRDELRNMGVGPGNGNSYFQDVPLVTMTATPDEVMTVRNDSAETIDLQFGPDMVIWTKRVTSRSEINDSEMVFVGYGIVAPEYNWNDYEGVDVEGKTVVILVNDPGYATQDPELFNGNAMTYYGRWTYKFEEAAKQGAAGALVIHETAPAAYPWSVVEGSWTGAQHDLVTPDKNMGRAAIEGWITDVRADQLFKAMGSSYEQAKKDALDRNIKAQPMGMSVSAGLSNTISVADSQNVVGKIEGSDRPDEYILYMAHWDHLGIDPTLEGDQIYNGAVDNATGTAGLLMIARAFTQLDVKPERSILFVAVTAEESGLLGSRQFANNPPMPLKKIVGGINMDALNVYGPTRDVSVIGYGSSELEQYLAKAASAQGRTIGPEPTPERGYFYRSDHFNMSKKGVPMLYAKGGVNLIDGGVEAGTAAQTAYTVNDYHKPSDEINDSWKPTGTAEDLQMFFDIGKQLAMESTFPSWYPGNEFRAIREASMAE
ncbi:MAG: M28 family metallopeptidase [Pseudomonadota bacterium]